MQHDNVNEVFQQSRIVGKIFEGELMVKTLTPTTAREMFVRSFWVAIGHAVVYYAWAAHTFSAEIKCRHCIST